MLKQSVKSNMQVDIKNCYYDICGSEITWLSRGEYGIGAEWIRKKLMKIIGSVAEIMVPIVLCADRTSSAYRSQPFKSWTSYTSWLSLGKHADNSQGTRFINHILFAIIVTAAQIGLTDDAMYLTCALCCPANRNPVAAMASAHIPLAGRCWLATPDTRLNNKCWVF